MPRRVARHAAPLGDGRVVWLFGDTRRAPGHGATMVSNSMLISTRGCFAQVLTGGAVIPDPGVAGERLAAWPTCVISLDRGRWSELFVCTNTIRRHGGFWGFTLLGTSVTRFVVPDGGAARRLETVALRADDDALDHVTWGTASVADDGWIVVYGTRAPTGGFGREVYVARTRPEDIENMARRQYRGATGWGTRRQMTPGTRLGPCET